MLLLLDPMLSFSTFCFSFLKCFHYIELLLLDMMYWFISTTLFRCWGFNFTRVGGRVLIVNIHWQARWHTFDVTVLSPTHLILAIWCRAELVGALQTDCFIDWLFAAAHAWLIKQVGGGTATHDKMMVRGVMHVVILVKFSLWNTAKTRIFLAERAVLKFKFIELTLHLLFLLSCRGLSDCHPTSSTFSGWLKVWLRLKGVACHVDGWWAVIETLGQVLAFWSHASDRSAITPKGALRPMLVHNCHFFTPLTLRILNGLCCFLKVFLDVVADFRCATRGIFGLLCTSGWLIVLLHFKWLNIHDLWLFPEALKLLS